MARQPSIRRSYPRIDPSSPQVGFEIVTPSEVQARVDALDDSWIQLKKSFPADNLVQNEAIEYGRWRKSIQDSYLSRLFASGTLNTLDEWKRRYEWAYNEARGKNPTIDPTAPTPQALTIPEQKTNWMWIAVGGVVAGLFAALVIRR